MLNINLPSIAPIKKRRIAISKIRQLAPTLEKIARRLLFTHQKNMLQDKKDPSTLTPWAMTRQTPGPRGILIRTGKLVTSFKTSQTGNTLSITNMAPYAEYHQSGTPRMPARPIIGASATEQKFLSRLILKDIRDIING